jgi:hypothetical protein
LCRVPALSDDRYPGIIVGSEQPRQVMWDLQKRKNTPSAQPF